jgi:cytochrome c2
MYFLFNSGALAGKGGKWNDKTLDKWLKSPADYAPGKYQLIKIQNT